MVPVVVVSIVILLIIWLYMSSCGNESKGLRVYRFYRPSCGYCVKSQPEWNKFKKICKFHMIDTVDINMSNSSLQEQALAKKYEVKSVPTVVAVKNGRVFYYNGDRSANSYMSWVEGLH